MKKVTSVLLSYCILIFQFGCTTTRFLSMEQAKTVNSPPQTLILHTPTTLFELFDYTFTEHTLEGNLKSFSKSTKPKMDVFISTNFDLNSYSNSGKHIIIKRLDIEYVTYTSHSVGKTFVLIGAGLTALLFIGLMQSNWLSIDMNWK